MREWRKTSRHLRYGLAPYGETVTAPSLDLALEAFWAGKDRSLAGRLLMFREIPWNTEYKWDTGKNKRRGSWQYVDSDHLIPLDATPADDKMTINH